MERRNLMKALGAAGAAGAFAGCASAQQGNGNGNGNSGNQGNSGYNEYNGNRMQAPPELGTFDHVLMYLAEGIIDGPTSSPHDNDPLLAKHWHFDIQKRTPEEVVADRTAHHDYMRDHYGIDMTAEVYGEAYSVPPATLAPPLGQRGAKARWAHPNYGPDEFTGTEVTDGVTQENMWDTFVWIPDPEGTSTQAVVPETNLMLEPKVGYQNVMKSGQGVPDNSEDDDSRDIGPTTNRSTTTTGKVRDGGYWIFAVEDDDLPVPLIVNYMEDSEWGKPNFWFNTQADGNKRVGRGIQGGKMPEIDPPDKMFFDGKGPDSGYHNAFPEDGGTFWGHYNINRGDNQAPFSIHYRSGFPTEFNPHSGMPRAFMCELQCHQFVTDRNPQGLGRVHGSTYPTATTVNGNTNGHNYRAHGAPEGFGASTIRNVLTFPASLTRGRDSDPDGHRRYNITPGWPEMMPDDQRDVPGYPEALAEDIDNDTCDSC